MNIPKTIKTERLILRPPIMQDAHAIFTSYAQDVEVVRYLSWKPHTSIEDTKIFLSQCIDKQKNKTHTSWVIENKSDGALLGMIELRIDQFSAQTGYVLARPYWGQGFMPEALIAVIKVAMKLSEVYRFSAFCDVDNKASARVMEKARLTKEGRLKRYFIHPNVDPLPRDCFSFSIVK